jgi:hypothetical protein
MEPRRRALTPLSERDATSERRNATLSRLAATPALADNRRQHETKL